MKKKIKQAAEKEKKRLKEIFEDLSVLDDARAREFYDFSKDYYDDGNYFLEKEDYIRAFEAFIIAWAYLDIGLKLGMFESSLTEHFTVD